MSDWWHLAVTPNGVHAHHIDPDLLVEFVGAATAERPNLDRATAEAETLGGIAAQIRGELAFPADWFELDGWDSALSTGQPHPKTLAAATVHEAL